MHAPDVYATKDNCGDEQKRQDFNRIQRGHQNVQEYEPIFLAMLLSSGVKVRCLCLLSAERFQGHESFA